MGVVFSTLGTALSWVGTLLETLCLAVGEIASVFVRGIFTVLIGLCDVFAALSCCWRRPWGERPVRGAYDGQYETLLNVGGEQVLKNLAKQPIRTEKAKKEGGADEEKALALEDQSAATTPATEAGEAVPAPAEVAEKKDEPAADAEEAAESKPTSTKARRFSLNFLKRNKAAPAPGSAAVKPTADEPLAGAAA